MGGSSGRSGGLESPSESAFTWALMGVTAQLLEDVTLDDTVVIVAKFLEQEGAAIARTLTLKGRGGRLPTN